MSNLLNEKSVYHAALSVLDLLVCCGNAILRAESELGSDYDEGYSNIANTINNGFAVLLADSFLKLS